MTDKKWDVPDDLRFKTTEYVVDASHEESHQIWYKFHMLYGVPFEQDSAGHCATIGEIDGRPICVTVFWFIIADLFRVAFVEGTSQLVDYKMIEDWEQAVFPCMKRGGRHANAENIHSVIGDIQRRVGEDKKLFKRSPMEIEQALRKL